MFIIIIIIDNHNNCNNNNINRHHRRACVKCVSPFSVSCVPCAACLRRSTSFYVSRARRCACTCERVSCEIIARDDVVNSSYRYTLLILYYTFLMKIIIQKWHVSRFALSLRSQSSGPSCKLVSSIRPTSSFSLFLFIPVSLSHTFSRCRS